VVDNWSEADIDSLAAILKRLSSYVRMLASKTTGGHNKRVVLLKALVKFDEKVSSKKQLAQLISLAMLVQ
jgi:hypothetical protein